MHLDCVRNGELEEWMVNVSYGILICLIGKKWMCYLILKHISRISEPHSHFQKTLIKLIIYEMLIQDSRS